MHGVDRAGDVRHNEVLVDFLRHEGDEGRADLRLDGFLVVLFNFLLSLLQAVVCSVGSFFAYRKLLYRDTCDTTPAARRYILARWQAAEGAVLSATMQVAGSVDTERNEMQ